MLTQLMLALNLVRCSSPTGVLQRIVCGSVIIARCIVHLAGLAAQQCCSSSKLRCTDNDDSPLSFTPQPDPVMTL